MRGERILRQKSVRRRATAAQHRASSGHLRARIKAERLLRYRWQRALTPSQSHPFGIPGAHSEHFVFELRVVFVFPHQLCERFCADLVTRLQSRFWMAADPARVARCARATWSDVPDAHARTPSATAGLQQPNPGSTRSQNTPPQPTPFGGHLWASRLLKKLIQQVCVAKTTERDAPPE